MTDINTFYMIFYLYVAYYTVRFALKVKREGNKLAAVIIMVVSVVEVAAPAIVFYIIK